MAKPKFMGTVDNKTRLKSITPKMLNEEKLSIARLEITWGDSRDGGGS